MTKVRTTTILIAVLSLAPFAAFSQFNLWVKAGVNFNGVAVQDFPASIPIETRQVSGLHAGIFTKLKIKGRFSLVPEIQFSQKGFALTLGEYGIPAYYPEEIITLNYVEVPLLLSFNIIKSFALDAGPSVAFKTSSKRRVGSTTGDASSVYNRDVDYGLNLGLRFEFLKKFSVITRYYYGMNAVTDYYSSTRVATFYNRTLQIGVAYKIL